MSAHRSVPKSRQTGERELDGLVWIQSWPGSEEGPAMRRESNRTSCCVCVRACVSHGVKRFCSRPMLLVCAEGEG